MTLCVNVSAGKAGRMYGNYANVWENFPYSESCSVPEGSLKTVCEKPASNPTLLDHCFGSLMAPVPSVAFSGPCCNAADTAKARAQGCKIPERTKHPSAVQHHRLPAGNKTVQPPCASAPSCPGLSLYLFAFSVWFTGMLGP